MVWLVYLSIAALFSLGVSVLHADNDTNGASPCITTAGESLSEQISRDQSGNSESEKIADELAACFLSDSEQPVDEAPPASHIEECAKSAAEEFLGGGSEENSPIDEAGMTQYLIECLSRPLVASDNTTEEDDRERVSRVRRRSVGTINPDIRPMLLCVDWGSYLISGDVWNVALCVDNSGDWYALGRSPALSPNSPDPCSFLQWHGSTSMPCQYEPRTYEFAPDVRTLSREFTRTWEPRIDGYDLENWLRSRAMGEYRLWQR